MSQELLGNVYEPGQKGLLCHLEVSSQRLLAVEHQPADGMEARRQEFPLEADSMSYSGDEGSLILFTNGAGAKLYIDRSRLEPVLRELASGPVLAKLRGEGARVSRANRNAWLLLAAFVAVVVLAGAGVLVTANWMVDRLVDRIPVEWEATLGQAVASSLTTAEVVDPAVTKPVQAVLDRVLAAAGENPYEFTLHVVESSDINAMAAPGGQIIVYTGLLEKAKTPEELAGVLGHEVQHVLGRHSLRNLVHAVKWQLLASAVLGDLSTAQSVLLAKAPELLSLSYGRGLEEESDLEGCRLLLKADIDPNGLTRFFKILQEQEGVAGAIPEVLSSHPDTGHRIEAIEAWLATQPEADGRYTPLDVDWAGMQKSLAESSKS